MRRLPRARRPAPTPVWLNNEPTLLSVNHCIKSTRYAGGMPHSAPGRQAPQQTTTTDRSGHSGARPAPPEDTSPETALLHACPTARQRHFDRPQLVHDRMYCRRLCEGFRELLTSEFLCEIRDSIPTVFRRAFDRSQAAASSVPRESKCSSSTYCRLCSSCTIKVTDLKKKDAGSK